MNNQNALLTTSPRSPLIAFLFSLLTPGLAQVYNGQLKKGILFFGILLVIPILFGLFNTAIHFYGFTSMFIVELLFRIYVLVDGVLVAKRHKNFQPRAYNTWYYHLGFALAAIIVLVFFDINERVSAVVRVSTKHLLPHFTAGDFFPSNVSH